MWDWIGSAESGPDECRRTNQEATETAEWENDGPGSKPGKTGQDWANLSVVCLRFCCVLFIGLSA